MAITQDGLSQLLSSYASDESEGSSSEKEDSAAKEDQTIEYVKVKGNPHKGDDTGCEDRTKTQRLAHVIFVKLQSSTIKLSVPIVQIFKL